jgi:hypothetical protein
MTAARIGHLPAHGHVADAQGRRLTQRRIEGRFDQHTAVADGRQQMVQTAGVPSRRGCRAGLRESLGRHAEPERRRR